MRLVTNLPLSMLLFIAAASGLPAQSATPATPGCDLRIVTERPDAIYAVGEPVKFKVSLTRGDAPVTSATLAFTMDRDGLTTLTRGAVPLENGAAVLEGRLDQPGFLFCRVSYVAPTGENIAALVSAGIEPTRIKPSLPVPEDFDAFWDKHKALLRAVPMEPALTSVASTTDSIECFDVQIPCHNGQPVSAYLARPIGAAPRSLPAVLSVHGAGVYSSSLASAISHAQNLDALVMDLNAHGVANGQPEAFYKEQAFLANYPFQGQQDRDAWYFVGMYLRLVRALDFLASRPEWDGKHLIVIGGSQGGGQAIAAAGLDPRVTLICVGQPALCDFSGPLLGRMSGWPFSVLTPRGALEPKVIEATRYCDGVNLASRVKAAARFSVGFIDEVCPPSSVYAAFNAIPGKKVMFNDPLLHHTGLGQSRVIPSREQIRE